jgi:ankyrin repeat protein
VEAAEFLASRGARLDLGGAAGVGRLDLVESFFNKDGTSSENVTRDQLMDGFEWACLFGRTSVVEFLLRKGVDVGTIHHGETSLHWAAYGGHVEIVKSLLARNAPVDVKDESYGASPVGWALHGWCNPPSGANRDSYYEVVALLVSRGAPVDPEWLENEEDRRADGKPPTDPRMLASLRGEFVS